LGNFGAKQIISTDADSACAVFATDIDGNGKMDVLSVSWDDDKVAWYKNLGFIGINEFDNNLQFSVFPNPTNDLFRIVIENESIALVEVFNVLGKQLMTSDKNEINLSQLGTGTYYIKTTTINGKKAITKVIKK